MLGAASEGRERERERERWEGRCDRRGNAMHGTQIPARRPTPPRWSDRAAAESQRDKNMHEPNTTDHVFLAPPTPQDIISDLGNQAELNMYNNYANTDRQTSGTDALND